MKLSTFARAGSAMVLGALPLLLAPTGATASGPETATCNGTSATPPIIFTSSTVTCAGAPDDSGTYTFTYSPPLNCNAPAGTFNVTATGAEFGLQGSGSYTAVPGSTSHATVTYLAF